MMLRVAVCDDEKIIRNYLISLIKRQPGEYSIAEYGSVDEYLGGGKKHDLIFLDIEMKGNDGSAAGGMELARQIRTPGQGIWPVIIFVTGHEQYVYDAFDVGAFQYLLKPINEERFTEIFLRAAELLADAERKKGKNKNPDALIVQFAGSTKTIPVADIYYIESCGHKIILHRKEGNDICYQKISDLELQLQNRFFRIHRGYLINLAYIDEYSHTEVTMTNGDTLLISKYKYRDFVNAYLHFMSA